MVRNLDGAHRCYGCGLPREEAPSEPGEGRLVVGLARLAGQDNIDQFVQRPARIAQVRLGVGAGGVEGYLSEIVLDAGHWGIIAERRTGVPVVAYI